jgi:hypothetical protein
MFSVHIQEYFMTPGPVNCQPGQRWSPYWGCDNVKAGFDYLSISEVEVAERNGQNTNHIPSRYLTALHQYKAV